MPHGFGCLERFFHTIRTCDSFIYVFAFFLSFYTNDKTESDFCTSQRVFPLKTAKAPPFKESYYEALSFTQKHSCRMDSTLSGGMRLSHVK